ncbi:MAG TPA: hypothetical protein VK738_13375 [Terriglobales bacterium]|jgi:hypothetical protein|nr:hypothetical protein [Terriglobales bacterium]
MGRSLGLIGLLIVLVVGAYIYTQQTKSSSMGTGNPRAVIDITGVKMDLLHMAQAERAFFARENHYASLEDLHASGDLTVFQNHRGPYTYSVSFTDNSFRITATYSGPPNPEAASSLSIDENMQVQ